MTGSGVHWIALAVFVGLFLFVTVLGFVAARWKPGDLSLLDEWGLGGRRFGIAITWFLVGGDLYTAYTIIAVPALVYSVGAYGFFAIPYAIITYPFVFAVIPRLWNACHRAGHLTAADFVHERYGHGGLALAVAVTGLIATMPYIALQLVGIQVVIARLGLGSGDIPMIVAFLILALYTYTSGLRAPAMIAFAKDVMIYLVVLAAVAVIPVQLGGYGAVFEAAERTFQSKSGTAGLTLKPAQMLPFASLALGSALALFMYPHSVTGILSASSARAVRWNAILLPAYTLLLGLVALLGYMAIASGIKVSNPNEIVPALFGHIFPEWFSGFSFAAIAIGALVPAAIMSIGAANLFTRNIWKPLLRPQISPQEEATVAKIVSLAVKVGALIFIIFLPTQYAIDFQLLGGILMLQILPSVVLGLYRSPCQGNALLLGWLIGMAVGIWLFALAGLKPVFAIHAFGNVFGVYIGVLALMANLVVGLGGSFLSLLLPK
jgi:solute:Na+ symporter, SSS family